MKEQDEGEERDEDIGTRRRLRSKTKINEQDEGDRARRI